MNEVRWMKRTFSMRDETGTEVFAGEGRVLQHLLPDGRWEDVPEISESVYAGRHDWTAPTGIARDSESGRPARWGK